MAFGVRRVRELTEILKMMRCMPPLVVFKSEEDWQRLGALPGMRKQRQIPLCRHHPYSVGKPSAKLKQNFSSDMDGSRLSQYAVSPFLLSILESHAPEFVAQIVCLIWFETNITISSVISRAQELNLLSPASFPKAEFLSWNRDVLSSINVSKNVIFLALLFIYRLKERNPTIRGKPGSEYRLLTIALILGNKFLDDNTYTNKTWSEITGIFVKEIHVMEAEFLANIHYSLLVSKTQWEDWQIILERLWIYCMDLMKSRCSLLSSPSLVVPADLASAYTNNSYSSQLMFTASTQIMSSVPPYACLKESPSELKYVDHISNKFAVLSVKRVFPSRIIIIMPVKNGFSLSRPVSRYFAGKGPEQVESESENESDHEVELENKNHISSFYERKVFKTQAPVLDFQKIDIHEKLDVNESLKDSFSEIRQNDSENLEFDEVTEYETEETEESEEELPKIRLKPIFISKYEREKYVGSNHFDIEKKKIIEQEKRKEETRMLLEEEIRKDEYKQSSDSDGGIDVDDTDDLCPESERAAWKLRELFRIKREKMFFEEKEKERQEIERRRNMDEEERLKEDLSHVKEQKENQPKSKMRFLQKWYHRGAFYQDEEILKRDYSVPVMDEISDKTLLPSTMQVRGDKFGKRGQTRYTHLVDQDTSTKDSPWFDKNINKRILPGTDDYDRKKRKF
ncbi:hypothetical protein PORY_000203 [Pneumocystis oryctolagi]|uniref:Uncharacterized protein n=1 Tax=Pneumocystis oryctolagi TaxID=42067 RepID=A0ACB7CFA8_9ASCO|nr:hypothetical protein PORY_000203 [Pneumocystis oryctolagi]